MRVYEASISYKIVQLGEVAKVDTPERVTEYLRSGMDEHAAVESFWVIALDRKNKPIARSMVTLGTATSSLVHPREVFRYALLQSAAAIIVAHNHPSGDPSPSAADIQVTRQLREAAKTVCIDLLDHVIVGNKEDDPSGNGFYSFRSAGLL
ncbi:DNA repair protein RadC [Opitutaceae bacterium EW11]|nr:DNA repair protein RadC [Opitutaceae bacterium EW11]